MVDHSLSRVQYEALLRAYKPLCSGCFDMSPSIFDWRAVTWANSYPSLSPLKIVVGSDNQCFSCMIIRNAFGSVGLELHTLHDAQYVSLHKREEKGSLFAMAVLDDKQHVVVELYTVPDKPFSPWTIISCKTHISGDTGSQICYQRIREWINHCDLNHKTCSSHKRAALPTRVLDLGKSNNSIRLIESRGLCGAYVCLSHCWGRSSTILCTKETYSSFQQNIPWLSLPLLFQDTIDVCRMLGVQYLWIDKLCIIQQDKKDWEREGARMAQTFESSFLTIAAAISHNDTESLFYKDERHPPSLGCFTGQTKGGSPYTINYRKPFNYHPTDGANHGPSSEKYPLMTRAWVYQERLLAPRTLYFGEELSWGCRETSSCECSGVGHQKEFGHSMALSAEYPAEKLHLRWQNMVEEFTWLRLSFEEDRLPAFSGLAQRYQPRLNSKYLAGLWRENLVADLLWFAYPDYGLEAKPYSTSRPRKWRAPSWSWASVEGPVLFVKDHNIFEEEAGAESVTCLVEIISAECSTCSLDPMGTVASGRLVVRGSCRPVHLEHRADEHGSRNFIVKSTGIRSVFVQSCFFVDGHDANMDYDLIEHGLMNPNSDMSVYCLRLASKTFAQRTFLRDRGDYDVRPMHKTWSLLLRRVDGTNFERIGFVNSDHLDDADRFWNNVQECTVTIT